LIHHAIPKSGFSKDFRKGRKGNQVEMETEHLKPLIFFLSCEDVLLFFGGRLCYFP